MRRLLVTGLCLVVLAPAAASRADDEPGSGLSSYTLLANAPGIGLQGLYKDVALTVPETTSSLSTGGVGTGLAALAWPGPVVGNAGTTLLVLNPSVPPQATALNDPVRAETHSGATEKASYTTLPGTVMTSSATGDAVHASSSTGTPTALPIGTVQSVTGSSSTVLKGAAGAVATATSAVTGLSLAGGQITVGGVTSTATVTSDGTKATTKGSTVVSDLVVGGVHVAVDGQHLQVAGTSVANPLSTQTLNGAVKALGLTVLVTEPHVVRNGAGASYDAGALVLLFSQGGNSYALTLGRASADLALTPGTPDQPDTSTDPGTSSGTASGSTAAPPATGGGSAATAVPPASLDAPVLPVSSAPVTAPSLPTAVAQVVTAVPAAVGVLLAGGAPAALVLPLLLGVGLLGFVLFRLPARLLTTAAAGGCEEEQG
ncbi:MAG: choice-of-anchor P family protein [Mycobacteriales bacterium]